MKTNLTLIGMPGAGKSTTGIILAKNLGLGFFDTDILIQINQQKRLQDILDSKGYLDLRKIEEQEILKINIENNVISTGGSAVYSQQAMTHLQSISKVIYHHQRWWLDVNRSKRLLSAIIQINSFVDHASYPLPRVS